MTNQNVLCIHIQLLTNEVLFALKLKKLPLATNPS